VLLKEVLSLLDPRPGEVYADATAGLGGHARAAAEHLAPGGRVVLVDADATMLERAREHVGGAPGVRVDAAHRSFSAIEGVLGELGVRADMVLADLGFASPHVDDPARGFSFRRDGPLDMRLDQSQGPTAADLIASLTEDELADILWRFGEERMARRIARKVAEARQRSPISTTGELATVVRSGTGGGGIDPATRSFQALRIAVNDELGALAALLDAITRAAQGGAAWLSPGARVAIIAFHSLEDRMVKQAFAKLHDAGLATRLTRKPITPGEAERAANPRARSARLRAIAINPAGA